LRGSTRFQERAGFTLAELLVVLAIISILALCIFRATQGAMARADVVRCMGNLRTLHIALSTAVTDLNQWPQCPYELGTPGYDQWWLNELTPYKITPAIWSCPTVLREQRTELKKDELKIHYIPTRFDANPFTPRKWPRMPWLIEIADAHGEGNLIVFPDGVIIGSNRYLSTK